MNSKWQPETCPYIWYDVPYIGPGLGLGFFLYWIRVLLQFLLQFRLYKQILWITFTLWFGGFNCIGWPRPIIEANTLEPFIEVVNALNKQKNNDQTHDILDERYEYLILQGYFIKVDKESLETTKKLSAEKSEIDILDKKVQDVFGLFRKWVSRSNLELIMS